MFAVIFTDTLNTRYFLGIILFYLLHNISDLVSIISICLILLYSSFLIMANFGIVAWGQLLPHSTVHVLIILWNSRNSGWQRTATAGKLCFVLKTALHCLICMYVQWVIKIWSHERVQTFYIVGDINNKI